MSKRKTFRNKSDLCPDSGAKPKKQKKRHIENLKEKFRKSREWKEFRSKMAVLANHRDYITGKRLVKGYNVHHLRTEQEAENYCDISNESEFLPLNPQSHKLLHYLFTYYQKDRGIIGRLVEVLDKMVELSPSNANNIQLEDVDSEDADSSDGQIIDGSEEHECGESEIL